MSAEFWRASCEFWQAMYGNRVLRFDVLEAERDEARAIAGELARCLRWMRTDDPACSCKACKTYRAIRPGVRRWLEGK